MRFGRHQKKSSIDARRVAKKILSAEPTVITVGRPLAANDNQAGDAPAEAAPAKAEPAATATDG